MSPYINVIFSVDDLYPTFHPRLVNPTVKKTKAVTFSTEPSISDPPLPHAEQASPTQQPSAPIVKSTPQAAGIDGSVVGA